MESSAGSAPGPRFGARAFWLSNAVWAALVAAVWLFGGGRDADSSGTPGVRDPSDATASGDSGQAGAASRGDGQSASANRGTIRHPLRPATSPGELGSGLVSALALSDPLARINRASELLLSLNAENVGEALEALENGPRGDIDDALFRQFLAAWAKFDGAAAVAYAQQEGEGRKVRHGDDTAMREWAEVDADAAIAFLKSQPNGTNTQELFHRAVEAIAETDVHRAAALAMSNAKSRARGSSIDLIADRLAEQGGENALRAWIAGIPSEGDNDMASFKAYAFMSATREVGRSDPDAIEGWIRSHLGESYVDGRAYHAAAEAIGGEDPGKGMDWLAKFPESSDRNAAMGWTVSRWANQDPEAASTWLSSQPLTEAHDPAVNALARRVARDDPAAAMAWANVIQSERQRGEALGQIGREWIQRDKAGAAQWLTDNPVPDRVLEYLARRLN